MTSKPRRAGLPLQRGAYGVILADPPWRFVTWSQTRQYKAPAQHYAVMGLDTIKALPVADLAAPDCLLLLWATQAQLHQAFSVMQCWGFEFKSSGAWAKQSPTGAKWAFGTGFLLRSAAEFWLIGTRGRPKPKSRSERNLIVASVREHSRKPDQAQEMLEGCSPRSGGASCSRVSVGQVGTSGDWTSRNSRAQHERR